MNTMKQCISYLQASRKPTIAFCVISLVPSLYPMKLLCGDGFMDFIHRPKNKILKILKN
jgi:hypothetical protein